MLWASFVFFTINWQRLRWRCKPQNQNPNGDNLIKQRQFDPQHTEPWRHPNRLFSDHKHWIVDLGFFVFLQKEDANEQRRAWMRLGFEESLPTEYLKLVCCGVWAGGSKSLALAPFATTSQVDLWLSPFVWPVFWVAELVRYEGVTRGSRCLVYSLVVVVIFLKFKEIIPLFLNYSIYIT